MLAIDIFGIVAAVGVVMYSLFIAYCRAKWRRIPTAPGTAGTTGNLSVSIVIVARNEAASIVSLLGNIKAQTYPGHLLEVILVNDQSDDDTVERAKSFAADNGMALRVIHLEASVGEGSRKKQAIKAAAALSEADVLVLTDADCNVQPNWVASHINYYTHFKEAKLVFGAFYFKGRNWASALLNLEAMSLTGVAAITNLIHKPTMCSGANLSYKRELIQELNPFDGNQQIASGDDEFMLHAVKTKYPNGAFYNKDQESLVSTDRPESLGALYHQRRRWAGKWKAYTVPWPRQLAAVVVAGNFVFICLFSFFLISLNPVWLMPVALKWLAEFAFSRKISENFNLGGLGQYFVLMEIIYPFYAVFFAIASNFGEYHWKGRVYP
ncbi:glycosyltransferase [uncultured Imperialibacter sp.]|uniref:glycosyltransferase n=1 Tax=uncultured Imperialibacter sp. TaxID=1672639 RepID=UPI0030D6EC4F|tara:strand:- start:69125 stop:70267 length:1143 start_codon:yes stop_codon:yes gene_type:complete